MESAIVGADPCVCPAERKSGHLTN